MWDNGGRNITLDQAEFIDVDPQSGDSRFNIETHTQFKKKNVPKIVWWVG